MTPAEILEIRTALAMTQEQLALLLGVHSLTVSKWERGLSQPNLHQQALLRAAEGAARQSPDIGPVIAAALVGAGVGVALFYLLRAAFEPAKPSQEAHDEPAHVRRRVHK